MEQLYSISEKFLELFNRDDLTEEEFIEQGNQLALMLQNKAENIVGYNFTLESNKNILKQEIQRLTDILKATESKQEKLLELIKKNMEKMNINDISTPIGNLKIKKNPVSVNIIDAKVIGPEYLNTKVTTTIDKNKIKDDLKKGILILGAELYENSTRLEIK